MVTPQLYCTQIKKFSACEFGLENVNKEIKLDQLYVLLSGGGKF